MVGKAYRRHVPKPDARGRRRAVVGRSLDGNVQRFEVGNKGTSQAESQQRLDAICDLYDRQCHELGIDYWANWVLPWAQRLAMGAIKVNGSDLAKRNDGQAAEELSIVSRLQSWGVPVHVADPDLQAAGNGFLKALVGQQVNDAVQQTLARLGVQWGPKLVEDVRQHVVPPDVANAETRTLHEAIEEYRSHLEDTGKRDNDGNLSSRVGKCRDRLRYLKDHHEDLPLWQLDFGAIDKMAAYWRNRPVTEKGTRCSWEHARDMNKELFRFLDWLDMNGAYKWEKPRGSNGIKHSPIKFPEDNKGEAFQTITKETYTPAQLAIIAAHTDDFGRALIGICVNCAFGASEIGQWPTCLIALYTPHPKADRVGIETTDADSWVVGPRPKTGVYGEHLLWPEVAAAVKPFLDGRSVLPITRRQAPWYRTHSSNPQSKFNRWWNVVLNRVQKQHEDFPRLPFGSLRDVLPNVLRQEFGDDVASICLQHGKVEDDLLKCYANVPYKKLFHATTQLVPIFRPFLDQLKTPGTGMARSAASRKSSAG